MIEDRVAGTARCADCGKTYRVPNRARAYRCKACGGSVRAEHGEPAAEELGQLRQAREDVDAQVVSCPGCLALNSREARTCIACDEPLDALEEDREAIAARRREVNDELRRAHQWIGAVTWAYRLGALAYVVATFFAIVALARTDVPLRPGILVVGLTTLLSVLLAIGAIQILFRPFLWTLVIAVLATAVSVIHHVGPNPLGIGLVGSAAWAALAWLALVPTWRFQQLMQRHKDLYILHHASAQTRRALKGHTAEDRHARLVDAMRRAAWRAWGASVTAALGVVLLGAAGTWMVVTNLRPQVLDDTLERFEAAWNASDLDGVVALFDANVREQRGAWLDGAFEGHGWRTSFPTLPARALERDDERHVRVDYDLGETVLATSWLLNGQVWTLIDLEVPVPPLEPLVARFQEAWGASDPRALVELFAEDARESMYRNVTSSAEGRGWESYPAIEETKIGNYADGDSTVIYEVERGKITTRWRLGPDGRWRLYGLELPTKWIRKGDGATPTDGAED